MLTSEKKIGSQHFYLLSYSSKRDTTGTTLEITDYEQRIRLTSLNTAEIHMTIVIFTNRKMH